ncbi:MAG: LysE family translocator [Rhodospirillaceae bacterium]
MENWITLIGMAFVMTATPGPNNVMVTASGATWGYRRTLPHILGISFGFPPMVLAVGLGLAEVIRAVPAFGPILAVVGLVVVARLTWKIATAKPPSADNATRSGRPMRFIEAAAFQWINPKAWIAALAVTATQVNLDSGVMAPWLQVLLVALVFLLVCIPSVSAWTLFGSAIGRLLHTPLHRKCFNGVMAALLAISMVPALLAGLEPGSIK